MYRICKTFWVETGHFLSNQNNSSNCKMPHGHSRKVEIILSSKELDENDMVCDFQVFKSAFGEYLDSFDHAMCINTDSPHYEYFKNNFSRIIPFEKKDPTSEVISEALFNFFDKELQGDKFYVIKDGSKYKISENVNLERVRIWETASCWAEFDRS